MVNNSYIEYSQCFSATMFWNKSLFIANIVEIYFTIDGIYYVTDYVFEKYLSKHDKNIFIEIKTSTKNLQNMIETYKLSQDKDQVYDRCNVVMKDFTSWVACFLLCFILMKDQ